MLRAPACSRFAMGSVRVAHRATATATAMTDYPKLPARLTRIFGNNPLFFVTFCSRRRRKVLATNSVNAAFLEFASRAHAMHNVAVGRYVIVPDHLHLFVCGPDDFELGRWVGA